MVKKRERAVIAPPSPAALSDETPPSTKPKPRAKKKVAPASPPEPKEEDDNEIVMDTFLIKTFEQIQIPRPKNPKPEDYLPSIQHDPEPKRQPSVEKKIAAFGDQAEPKRKHRSRSERIQTALKKLPDLPVAERHQKRPKIHKTFMFSLTEEISKEIDALVLSSDTHRLSRSDIVKAGILALKKMGCKKREALFSCFDEE
jgi:Arc/MetJ-type ribon-helix-helix transcriptional regulator